VSRRISGWYVGRPNLLRDVDGWSDLPTQRRFFDSLRSLRMTSFWGTLAQDDTRVCLRERESRRVPTRINSVACKGRLLDVWASPTWWPDKENGRECGRCDTTGVRGCAQRRRDFEPPDDAEDLEDDPALEPLDPEDRAPAEPEDDRDGARAAGADLEDPPERVPTDVEGRV